MFYKVNNVLQLLSCEEKNHASPSCFEMSVGNSNLDHPQILEFYGISPRDIESGFDQVSVSSPSPSGLLCLIGVFWLLASLNFLHKD